MRLSILLIAASAFAAPNRVQVHPPAPFPIYGLAPSPDGLLYIATSSGLLQYDGFRYAPVEGFPFDGLGAIALTSDGTVWAGDSSRGIARYSPKPDRK